MTTITMKEVAAFLLGEASLDGYWFGERHPISPFWWREHLRASQPATAPEPSWQDAPTVPGLWVVDEKLWRITKPELHEGSEDRWFGPLPEDKP